MEWDCGLVEYSKFLVNNGVDFLAVANIEEAIILRNSKIEAEILMMTPISKEKELLELIKNKIILTVSSKNQIEMIEKIAKSENLEPKAHIKIDTGFARYGFLYTEFEDVLECLNKCDRLQITGMYTHFARPLDEKFTWKQFNRFLDMVKFLKENGQDIEMLHVSESTAFLKYPIMNLNAVRIGSLIQGRTLIPVDGLIKIGNLKSSINEIKLLPKGYNISYGNMFKTKKETKIAVIPVGYIDGLNMRKDRDIFSFKENILSVGIEIKKFFKDNIIKVIINGKKYNIIGRIGMYHCVVDITNSNDITLESEAIFEIPPLQINSMIKREYI